MTAPSKAGMPPVAQAIITAIEGAVTIARLLGDLETAKRVEEVLRERFPEFYRRAAAAAETARARLAGE